MDSNKDFDAYNSYMNALEAYEDLIVIDKKNQELLNKHIIKIKDIYVRLKEIILALGIEDNVKSEYPRLRTYLE